MFREICRCSARKEGVGTYLPEHGSSRRPQRSLKVLGESSMMRLTSKLHSTRCPSEAHRSPLLPPRLTHCRLFVEGWTLRAAWKDAALQESMAQSLRAYSASASRHDLMNPGFVRKSSRIWLLSWSTSLGFNGQHGTVDAGRCTNFGRTET